MAGLEPADEGVKVPCLTTWLHPYLKNHQGLGSLPIPDLSGVGEGARTLDTRNHNPVLCQLSYTHQISEPYASIGKVARQKGFEPLTYCLEGSCSILLSYWRI